MDFAPKIDQIVDKELSGKTRTSLLLLFPWSNQKYLQELSITECVEKMQSDHFTMASVAYYKIYMYING